MAVMNRKIADLEDLPTLAKKLLKQEITIEEFKNELRGLKHQVKELHRLLGEEKKALKKLGNLKG